MVRSCSSCSFQRRDAGSEIRCKEYSIAAVLCRGKLRSPICDCFSNCERLAPLFGLADDILQFCGGALMTERLKCPSADVMPCVFVGARAISNDRRYQGSLLATPVAKLSAAQEYTRCAVYARSWVAHAFPTFGAPTRCPSRVPNTPQGRVHSSSRSRRPDRCSAAARVPSRRSLRPDRRTSF